MGWPRGGSAGSSIQFGHALGYYTDDSRAHRICAERRMSAQDPQFNRLRGPLRFVLSALCVLLAAEALANIARWRANRDELQQLLGESASEAEDVIRRVGFERTEHHAQLITARALVYEVLAPVGDPDTPVAGRPSVGRPAVGKPRGDATAVERLARARELALAVLRQQPNSWQASMFLGAATYLEWSLRSDRRLYTAADQWEAPLLKAREEARGKPEPRRFLVSAYLETWAALSPEKKQFAAELLRETLREDPGTFARLAPVWLEVAGSRERALEIIPDQPAAWQMLERTYAAAKDWESFSLARRRYLDALERDLERQLEEAAERLRLGDLRHSRSICLTVVVSAPREGRFAGLVTRALDIYPPGLHGLRAIGPLQEWLNWALELNTISVDPFAPRTLGHLTDAIGELEPSVGALAALVGDDVYRTERYERLADSKRSKEWARFLIAKSRILVERDELVVAERTLGDVHQSMRTSASYWLARQRWARAAGDLVGLGESQDRLAKIRSREWLPLDWRWRGRRATLELFPALPASGPTKISIKINKAPEKGAVVALFWDGSIVDLRSVEARDAIELTVQIEPRPHLLELRSLAGGEVYPGRVRLVD